jgi:hypothetical protein
MKIAVMAVLTVLGMTACGPQPQGSASSAPRVFDTQRNALDQAKKVNDSVTQGADALRAQEEAQAK